MRSKGQSDKDSPMRPGFLQLMTTQIPTAIKTSTAVVVNKIGSESKSNNQPITEAGEARSNSFQQSVYLHALLWSFGKRERKKERRKVTFPELHSLNFGDVKHWFRCEEVTFFEKPIADPA